MMGRLSPVFGLLFLSALLLSPADAALRVCNRTSYVLYAAAGALTAPDLASTGWTRIVPGACAEAVKGDLLAEAYYLYARSSRAHSGTPRAWSGTTNLCVKDKDFVLRQPFGARCPAEAYEAGFAQIDTQHLRNWTTTLREAPDLSSMKAAENAGLKRLLTDLGARGVDNDAKFLGALFTFRRRLHLADKAPVPAVFDALETEAMKSAVPVGYTLCNDTNATVWAAIGQKKGNAVVSRGWWTVPGGACAHLVTESIAGQKIWLRIERGKDVPLAGPARFCVTNIEFDIQGQGRCAQRGLVEAGFAETNSKGAPGFTAHITGAGLR